MPALLTLVHHHVHHCKDHAVMPNTSTLICLLQFVLVLHFTP